MNKTKLNESVCAKIDAVGDLIFFNPKNNRHYFAVISDDLPKLRKLLK